jgi:hypothetical protein
VSLAGQVFREWSIDVLDLDDLLTVCGQVREIGDVAIRSYPDRQGLRFYLEILDLDEED